MATETLEIQLKQPTDSFQVKNYLSRFLNIDCNVISCQVIQVTYNTKKIVGKRVLKLVQQAAGTGKRERNIISAKEIKQTQYEFKN